jgi:hypothetical protein
MIALLTNELEIWCSSRDVFTIKVIDPAGNSSQGTSADDDGIFNFTLGCSASMYAMDAWIEGDTRDPANGNADQSFLKTPISIPR